MKYKRNLNKDYLFVRIDWGYDKEIGYFVGEIEPEPGFFTEVYDNGNSRWTIDKELEIYILSNSKK